MSERIGTCSLCGGPVVTTGYGHLSAHCTSCGALRKPAVIEMERPLRPNRTPVHTKEDIRGSRISNTKD